MQSLNGIAGFFEYLYWLSVLGSVALMSTQAESTNIGHTEGPIVSPSSHMTLQMVSEPWSTECCMVLTTRKHARVVVELDRVDLPHMTRYPSNRLAGRHVPQEDGAIPSTRRKSVVVVRPGLQHFQQSTVKFMTLLAERRQACTHTVNESTS